VYSSSTCAQSSAKTNFSDSLTHTHTHTLKQILVVGLIYLSGAIVNKLRTSCNLSAAHYHLLFVCLTILHSLHLQMLTAAAALSLSFT